MSLPHGEVDPALPLLWRAPGVLQVGIDPQRAVAVSGVSSQVVGLLRGVMVAADEADAQAVELLDAAGLLVRQRPQQRWAAAWVQVVGQGPVATSVVDCLRSSGVGEVSTADEPTTSGPDLVLVAPSQGRGLVHGEALLASTVVHLWAHVRDGRAVVGPLVVPGASSCLRCHDLHRTDADDAWPALALAWEQLPASTPGAAAVSLLAAVSARQVLAWLGGSRPASVDATLEEQPDGRLVRMPSSVHPECGCGWAREDPSSPAAESGQDVR